MSQARNFGRAGVASDQSDRIVVRDMARAVEFYEGVFGSGLDVYESTPDKYCSRGSRRTCGCGRQGNAGDIELELVQPWRGVSFHDSLPHRRGFAPSCVQYRDFDGMVRRFQDAGFQSLLLAEAYVPTYQGTVRACHFDTRAVGGVIFEVVWKSC